jgi:hypothetical protein
MKKLILFATLLITTVLTAQTKNELKLMQKAMGEIETTVDKFDETIDWSSPTWGKGFSSSVLKPFKFIRIRRKDGSLTTYMRVITYGASLNVGIGGLIVLFEDGTRFERPGAKVSVEATSGSYWEYRAFERVTDEELMLFESKKIDSFRLFIYDGTVSPREKIKIMGYAKAIRFKK